MNNVMKSITTKDGYTVIRKKLVLHVNKDRKYKIMKGKTFVASNCTWADVIRILSYLRKE